MRRLFILTLVWLMGSGFTPTFAADWFSKGETLDYKVYWGPLRLGKATLKFSSTAGSYNAEALVKGRMPFFSIEDTWSANGTVAKNGLESREYRAIQAENDYRANKRLTFNQKARTMLYENLHDTSEPKITVKLPQGSNDPFSTLYDLRKNGLPKEKWSHEVMGLKRPFTLTVEPPVAEEMNDKKLLKVTLHKTDPAKPGVETWHIWLTDDAELVPVQIVAELKVGSFRAVLNGHAPMQTTKQENIP